MSHWWRVGTGNPLDRENLVAMANFLLLLLLLLLLFFFSSLSSSTYSFADKDPLVNAMTGPELPLEFVSEFSSKDESCNIKRNEYL